MQQLFSGSVRFVSADGRRAVVQVTSGSHSVIRLAEPGMLSVDDQVAGKLKQLGHIILYGARSADLPLTAIVEAAELPPDEAAARARRQDGS